MKTLEAFTLGKRYGQPELNEDSLVIVPDVGYAVIDGVTDRNGTTYGGMMSGRFASRAAGRAYNRFLLDLADDPSAYAGPEALVAKLSDAVAQGYRNKGVYEQAQQDRSIRAGCAVMLAFIVGDQLEIVSVGDSGLRINGDVALQALKPLDDVTGRLRREAWRYFEQRGASLDELIRLSSSVTWQGTRNQPSDLPTSEPEAIAEIERRALAVNREALPDVHEDELLELIHNGIVNGQGKFDNVADKALGYGVINGFAVHSRHIDTRTVPLAEVETLELFSDGYFSTSAKFCIDAWEAEFRRVEEEDPHKIGAYLSTKGTTPQALTDDRTYLGIRLK